MQAFANHCLYMKHNSPSFVRTLTSNCSGKQFSISVWFLIQFVFFALCRRNDPISRPHSWHATKFNENQSDAAKTQSPPMPVWQTRYDAR